MLKVILLLSALVLTAARASAGTIVTWEATGELVRSVNYYAQPPAAFPPYPVAPPVGTPYTIAVSFVPSNQQLTSGAPDGSTCFITPATGSLQLGDSSYALSGNVFTNAFLPGSNCLASPSGFQPPNDIEFFMFPGQPDPDEWQLQGGFILAYYWDLNHQDGTLPESPTLGPYWSNLFIKNFFFEVEGPFRPRAVAPEQPTPVPEPASMVLVGIGLVYLGRQRWRSSRVSRTNPCESISTESGMDEAPTVARS